MAEVERVTEDYVDAVHTGMKHALSVAAKVIGHITDRIQLSATEEEWKLGHNLYVLPKRKTA